MDKTKLDLFHSNDPKMDRNLLFIVIIHRRQDSKIWTFNFSKKLKDITN